VTDSGPESNASDPSERRWYDPRVGGAAANGSRPRDGSYHRPVTEFLSAAWLARLDELAQASPALTDAADEPVVIEQHVVRDDGETVVYHLVLGPGAARVHHGPATGADLILVTTEDAARRIHAGTTNAQSCLADGTLRLRGNPDVLARHAEVLAQVGDVFADARR
jgi:hypothetical protein